MNILDYDYIKLGIAVSLFIIAFVSYEVLKQ